MTNHSNVLDFDRIASIVFDFEPLVAEKVRS